MRPLFIVGVKLLGLLVLYWALQHIPPILSSAQLLWRESPANSSVFNPVWNMITVSVSFVVAISFGLVLLFRGERIASLVSMPELPASAVAVDPDGLLRVGILISGLLVACSAVPKVLLEAFAAAAAPSSEYSLPTYTVYGRARLTESGIQLAMAWLLVFRSAQVARFIGSRTGKERSLSATAEPGGAADAEDGAADRRR